ncbi:MAG: hypothetical protein A2086_16670 [Spirochaetes bacterium GWD1_27_9]|nr:MAG: hypothetical protein A2086_16670 [Spirochaetes bacterium GWD1_27_9]
MALEMEKKFIVLNFSQLFEQLKRDFGKFDFESKTGFWFANNFSGLESMIELPDPKFLKKDVLLIKDIGEFELPIQDFRFIRLRIINNEKFMITFKMKMLVNKIEQNTEYEYEVDKDVFMRVLNFLNETSLIFYYNKKESYEFSVGEIKIEISKFNDLKDSYLEVEVLGKDENILNTKLQKFLEKMGNYSLKEESRNYAELSAIENRLTLRNQKLSNYSKEAFKEIYNLLNKKEGE